MGEPTLWDDPTPSPAIIDNLTSGRSTANVSDALQSHPEPRHPLA